jgi:DNA-binding PadR family transcriptional regulator
MLVGGESLVGKDVPGEFEQVVLLALAAQDTRATGRMVYEAIRAATGREPSVAAVHITLGRLVEKGWAECTTLSPDPVRGGKPRRRYALSPAGAATLKRLRTQLEALWERATGHPLLGDPAS